MAQQTGEKHDKMAVRSKYKKGESWCNNSRPMIFDGDSSFVP